MERWRSSRRMNIMSKSFPVVVRLEWASASASTARYLVTLDMDNLPRALHCPSIDQVCSSCSLHGCRVWWLKPDACLETLPWAALAGACVLLASMQHLQISSAP